MADAHLTWGNGDKDEVHKENLKWFVEPIVAVYELMMAM